MKNVAMSILRFQTLPWCHLPYPAPSLTAEVSVWAAQTFFFLFFCAVSQCCGASAAIRMSRQHLCLRLTAALHPGRLLPLRGVWRQSTRTFFYRIQTELMKIGDSDERCALAGSRAVDRLWTSLRALTFAGFCCNIWYNLSTWTSLFPPFQEFLPVLAFKGLLIDFWWKLSILKYPATCYHDSRQMFCSIAHEIKLILPSHHYLPHIVLKILPTVPPISPGYHNNLAAKDQNITSSSDNKLSLNVDDISH